MLFDLSDVQIRITGKVKNKKLLNRRKINIVEVMKMCQS